MLAHDADGGMDVAAGDRVALLRHRAAAAAAVVVGLEDLADLGLHHQLDVHAELAQRAADEAQQRAGLGDVVADRVPGDHGLLQAELGAQAGLRLHRALFQRRQRAGGAGELADQHAFLELRQALAVAQDRRQQAGHLVAEGHRDRLLQVAAADHRRQAMVLRQLGHRRRDRGEFVVHQLQRLADLQHGGGVGDVLRGRAPVHELAELVAAQLVELRDDAQDRVADALGLLAQPRHVDLLDPAVADDLVGRFLRDQAQTPLHDGQGPFDLDVLGGAVLVAPDLAHRVGREDALEDGRVDDGGGHGGFLFNGRAARCGARVRSRVCRSFGRRAGRPRRLRCRRQQARVRPSASSSALGASSA